MACLALPISMFRKRCIGSQLGYQPLAEDGFGEMESPVTVVVGKEKKEYLVDPFVLEESPFRVLIETMNKNKNKERVNCHNRRPVVCGKERWFLWMWMLFCLSTCCGCCIMIVLLCLSSISKRLLTSMLRIIRER